MSDWPQLQTSPTGIISTYSRFSLFAQMSSAQTLTTGAVWPAANRALYIGFLVEATVVATKMAFNVTVQSGNCDVGIYDEPGNRKVSKGSTAVGAAGIQVIDITDTTLTPGQYWMALCVDNTTAAVARTTGADTQTERLCMREQAVGAVTLPDPATFANPSTTAYVPYLAVVLGQAVF